MHYYKREAGLVLSVFDGLERTNGPALDKIIVSGFAVPFRDIICPYSYPLGHLSSWMGR
jgi:hypothetical protein